MNQFENICTVPGVALISSSYFEVLAHTGMDTKRVIRGMQD